MTRARTLADLGSASLATDAELAGEVSTINSAIAAKPTYAFSASAPSSPSNGDLWMDTSGASPKGKVWNGSEWKSFSGASPATFDEGASTGATFSTLTNPDGDGKNYRLAAFTSTSGGSLMITDAGVAQFLIVAGGGGGRGNWFQYHHGGYGAGGPWFEGELPIEAGSHAITVGSGGAGGPVGNIPKKDGNVGGYSEVAGVLRVCGNNAISQTVSLVSTFAGSSYEYGKGNNATGVSSLTTFGGGGGGATAAAGNTAGYTGAQGVVYVRIEI